MRKLKCHAILILLSVACTACQVQTTQSSRQIAATQKEIKPMNNAISYFEIPVTDMNRAVVFYETVLAMKLERQTIDGYEMALFPYIDGAPGASGALAKGDVYKPSESGSIIYFSVADIDAVLSRANKLNATVLYAKKDVGDAGFVAEIRDSEGNRMAFSQRK